MEGMSRTTIIIAAAVVALIFAGAGAMVAFDESRSDTIAKGISVGGVDVGGLSASRARATLRERLVARLHSKLVVVAGETRFPLSAHAARIETDLDGMVAQVSRRSRHGGVFARTWRAVTGAQVKADLTPHVGYSRAAVQRLVARVRRRISRKPVDANVSVAGQRVVVQRSLPGLAVDPAALSAQVRKALVSAAPGARLVRAKLRKTAPKVTTARLAQRYTTILAVDRTHFRISLFKHLKRVLTYPIAVGQVGLETPAGRYTIQNKAVNPAWHVPNSAWAGSLAGQVIPGGAPNNPIRSRWLGIYDGVGVHGTSDRASIGSNASHGCIRMLVEDVEKLYDRVPIGTPVFIA
jgi:lipoprotein-anchoring transpeptidase ErfK/SrfK